MNFVFTTGVSPDNNKIAVTTKNKWNVNNGYLPSDHRSHLESFDFLKSISSDFTELSECVFCFTSPTVKNTKKGKQILLAAGAIESNLGVKVD